MGSWDQFKKCQISALIVLLSGKSSFGSRQLGALSLAIAQRNFKEIGHGNSYLNNRGCSRLQVSLLCVKGIKALQRGPRQLRFELELTGNEPYKLALTCWVSGGSRARNWHQPTTRQKAKHATGGEGLLSGIFFLFFKRVCHLALGAGQGSPHCCATKGMTASSSLDPGLGDCGSCKGCDCQQQAMSLSMCDCGSCKHALEVAFYGCFLPF
eukprot:392743-Pelagomonas_calceolata.AAC.1